jgi:hypothetical protein
VVGRRHAASQNVRHIVQLSDGVVPGGSFAGCRHLVDAGLSVLQSPADARFHVFGTDPVEGDPEVVLQEGVGCVGHSGRGRRSGGLFKQT